MNKSLLDFGYVDESSGTTLNSVLFCMVVCLSFCKESTSVVHSECGYRCGRFPSSEKYKYCTKIMEKRGPHMWMKGTSETKIKLIVYLEFFLATCALMWKMGELGTFMCEKLQG